jgi:hypothetical protein
VPPEPEIRLAGTFEVAKILGVDEETVARLPASWDLVPPFPDPIDTLVEHGPVYDADAIRRWKLEREKAWRRTTGAPR